MKASNSNLARPLARRLALLAVPLAAIVVGSSIGACATSVDPPGATSQVDVDQAEIVHGVGDQGRNPAVVALGIGNVGLCTATLIAPDVILTARHCVSVTSESVACPAQGPQISGERRATTLRVLVGDDVSTAREVAHGVEVLTPESNQLCDEDVALVVLDHAVDGITPLDVHQEGIAKGGHVTAIGYGRSGDGQPAGVKLLREHVRVLDTSPREFMVGEATCQGDSGGPALDEASGEIVGVVSRGGPACDSSNAHNIYTRTDAFLSLVQRALAKSSAKPPPKKKPTGSSDMGAACTKGSDCATGICVKESGREYCSRPCDSADHCPTHFRCTATSSASVCVEH